MRRYIQMVHPIFDTLERYWEGDAGQRMVANLLLFSFVAGLLVIEVSRQDILTTVAGFQIPTNHFYAVDFTFKMLLLAELAALIFGLAHSVANSVGKQIEILSLILLRETFKEFTHFEEPIMWAQVQPVLQPMLIEAAGALSVFVILGFYYRAQRHRAIVDDAQELASFIAAKKIVALSLLLTFVSIGGYMLVRWWTMGQPAAFFEACYTILVFADVLLVLVSLRYTTTYAVVFRNSGFAIATVLIRLALIAPPPVNVGLGIGAALFALGLTVAYNTFANILTEQHAPSHA